MTATTPSPQETEFLRFESEPERIITDLLLSSTRTNSALAADLIAALAAHGYGIRPREPTEAMALAGDAFDESPYIWRAMWDAGEKE